MAQCLDKLTPDAFVHSQWIQMWFWSGSHLMTCLLLLESATGEPHGDASRYPLGIPGRVTELAGVWDYPRVLWLYPKPPRRGQWLRGVCVIPAVWGLCNSSCMTEVWSSAGQHLPQAQILRITHCCCLLCFHGLGLTGVNSRYCCDPNSVLCFQWSCYQCITLVP